MGSAPTNGVNLTAASPAVSFAYGELTSLVGNDCPQLDPPPPEGIISVSIEGHRVGSDGQVSSSAGLFTICIPRPDLLLDGPRSLGKSQSTADVRFFDLSANVDDGCIYRLAPQGVVEGTATASGVCENADAEAGFSMTFDGVADLERQCGTEITTVRVELTGDVAITRRQL